MKMGLLYATLALLTVVGSTLVSGFITRDPVMAYLLSICLATLMFMVIVPIIYLVRQSPTNDTFSGVKAGDITHMHLDQYRRDSEVKNQI